MTAWDRQEPFRLKIPDRIRVTQGASSPRILCDAPEVFLFPVGWSTTLWLRLLGPLKLEDLPTTLWALDSEPSIRITPGEADPMRLSTVLDTLRDRVAMILYGRSLARRARRIIRQRVVAVIAREASELERPYMDEDLRVIYGALEPSVDGVGPVWVMASSSQEVKQDKGKVVIRYGRGLFLDLQTNPGWTRCQARNFRNMVMMCTVLQATVKFGTTRLPEDLAAFVQLPNEKKAPLRDLYRLVSNGQKILRKLPSAYRPTTCAFYYGQHKEIQDALTQALPNLEP
jgi:hypothetical protein